MSSTNTIGSNESPIDRIPDEILHKILLYAMERDPPLFPERTYHIQASPRPRAPDADLLVDVETGNRGKHQVNHANEWIMINSTNRRIRRVGKECFWSVKTVKLSIESAERLHSGTADLQFGGFSAEDQRIAAANIRHLFLLGQVGQRPVFYLKLPAVVKLFPRLRSVVASFGYTLGGGVGYLNPKWTTVDVPDTLMECLRDLGLPEGVKFEMMLWDSKRGSEDRMKVQLEAQVYPVLKLKARFRKQAMGATA